MALPRGFSQVDVFCATPGLGNPLAVVLGDADLDDARMQAIATWTNLAETTFLLPPTAPGADYRVRIFTTRQEIAFAGHPSIGSAHAALAVGLVSLPVGGLLQQECRAGVLPIRVDDGGEGLGCCRCGCRDRAGSGTRKAMTCCSGARSRDGASATWPRRWSRAAAAGGWPSWPTSARCGRCNPMQPPSARWRMRAAAWACACSPAATAQAHALVVRAFPLGVGLQRRSRVGRGQCRHRRLPRRSWRTRLARANLSRQPGPRDGPRRATAPADRRRGPGLGRRAVPHRHPRLGPLVAVSGRKKKGPCGPFRLQLCDVRCRTQRL